MSDGPCATALAEMVEAIESGAVRIDSPNVGAGDPEIGYELHYWHEEWLHHAKQALASPKPSAREIDEILDQLEEHSPNWVAKIRAYIAY